MQKHNFIKSDMFAERVNDSYNNYNDAQRSQARALIEIKAEQMGKEFNKDNYEASMDLARELIGVARAFFELGLIDYDFSEISINYALTIEELSNV
jgi:hypothetical protein